MSDQQNVTVNLDPSTLGVLKSGGLKSGLEQLQRVQQLGPLFYLQASTMQNGVYLPTDLPQLLRDAHCTGRRLVTPGGEDLDSGLLSSLYDLLNEPFQVGLASMSADYGSGALSGDIGEKRRVSLDGKTLDVLVIPQGGMRAAENVRNLQTALLKNPVSEEQVRGVMATLMGTSDFNYPYFRMKALGDYGNNFTLASGDPLSAMVTAVTWQFFAQCARDLPPNRKLLVASPYPILGSPQEQGKCTSRYQFRLGIKGELLGNQTGAWKANDVAYFTQNGMLADLTCQNLAYVVVDPETKNRRKVIFVEGSDGNYFFVGKTQRTMYEVLARCMSEVTVAVVKSPQEFAEAAGYDNTRAHSGRDLTRAAIRSKVDYMLALGTFRGAEVCYGFEGRNFPAQHLDLYQTLNRHFWQSVAGTGGGNELTRDPKYCLMYDLREIQNARREGRAPQPLDLRGKSLEDI